MVFLACPWKQLIQSDGPQIFVGPDLSLRVCLARNFFHAKERFSPYYATSPSSGEAQVFQSWCQSLIYLSNLAIPKQGSVTASCFRIEREQYHSGSFPIETMDGRQGFRCSLFSQSDQKRFMEKSPRGNHRQEMRLSATRMCSS